MESKGGAVVGSDGGRGSYGGERVWCRVLERGNSPGLIVACVRSLSPMSAHHFPCPCHCPCPCVVALSLHCCLCPCVIACVCTLLPTSTCCCPYPHIVAHVHTLLPMSAHHCPHLFMFMGGRFRSWVWVVAFVGGQSSSFVGNGTVWWWGAVGGWW